MNYIGAWLFYFLFHFVIRSEIDSYIANILQNIVVLGIVCWIAYQASVKIKAMLIIFAVSLGSVSEEIVVMLLYMIKGNIEGNIWLYSLISKVIFWLCVRILGMLYKGEMESLKNSRYGVMVMATAGCNIIWISMIFRIAERTKDELIKTWLLVFVFVILVCDIVVFKLYVMYQKEKQLERERQEYALQVKMYDQHIESRKEMMGEVHRIKHDMKNNMVYLQMLLKENPKEAESYLNDYMKVNMENLREFSNSGNLAVDALLNYKNMIAAEKNVFINLDIQIPNSLHYKSSDLCVILGNLLDNAIEAAENSENKEIDVRIVYVKNKLKITVKNYYTGKIKKDTGGNFISTKSDTKNHGIGLQSVTRIVEAYGGVMEVRTDHSVFQVDIIM